jgi:hypothetical protein
MIGRSLMLGGCIGLFFAGAAMAGDRNTLYLTQTSDGPLGNSFYADQSQSHDNTIHAMQSGDGNTARINTLCSGDLAQSCGGGDITLTQNDAGPLAGGDLFTVDGARVSNYASISTQNDSVAIVEQLGGGNSATLDVIDGTGTVRQNGNDNTAELTVEDGTIGTIIQNNDHNSAAFTVTGARGAGATLTQSGGQTYAGPVVVDTPNAGVTVTVTQQ